MAVQTIAQLEQRVAENTIEMAQRALGFNYVDVASALGVDRRTILRYRQGKSTPSVSTKEKMARIREIVQLLDEVFVDEQAKLEWLYAPVPMLRGRQPIDLIRQGRLDEVESILSGLLSGASS